MFTCKEILAKDSISSKELEELLHVRAKGECEFLLVDVRELFEFEEKSIVGVNLLLPFTRIHLYEKELEKLKQMPFVLYCRTGNRTGHLLQVFGRMGFTQRCHLGDGIVTYDGQTMYNAPLPNELI
jgi:rhodanese-related sulfurtransferase